MKENSRLRFLDILILTLVIGIIGTIALPAYHNNMNRAKAYEAEMTLETVRHLLLSYYQKEGHFPIVLQPTLLINIQDIEVDSVNLNGMYYKATDYYYLSDEDGIKFKIKAQNLTPEMKQLIREINENGQIVNKISF